tara:strand:+ start:779 stop:1912 length:1134 start_codon:yes stop_codon:yes gene_type:complete
VTDLHNEQAEGVVTEAEQADLIALMARLPHALGATEVTGVFKKTPGDFVVDEVLGFNCTGQGEHVWVQVQKTMLTTLDVAQRITEVTGVPLKRISYSGLKDKQGVCSQWFSIHDKSLSESIIQELDSDNLKILAVSRNSRKLRRGSHGANHFRLRLTGLRSKCGTDSSPELLLSSRLQSIASQGVPNYFGEQRFGFDNIENAFAYLDTLAKRSEENRVPRASRTQRSMWLSAARSSLFNAVLAARVQQGNWDSLLDGDVMNLDGTGSVFLADSEDPALPERLSRMDIHPTGPLWGKGALRSLGGTRALEQACCLRWPTLCHGLERAGLEQQRRSLRLPVKRLHYRFFDSDQLELSFELPAGCFATAVLHELLDYSQA